MKSRWAIKHIWLRMYRCTEAIVLFQYTVKPVRAQSI